MSNTSAFVPLDKYIQDLTQERVMNYYADCKIKRFELYIHQVLELIYPFCQSLGSDSAIWQAKEKLEECLNFERPDLIFPEDSKKRIKFSSVADGVPLNLEFEGER